MGDLCLQAHAMKIEINIVVKFNYIHSKTNLLKIDENLLRPAKIQRQKKSSVSEENLDLDLSFLRRY